MDTKTAPLTAASLSSPFSLLDPHKTLMIDLHGFSPEQAQQQVTKYVKEAPSSGWNKIRFVTGRGNHVNASGDRGTLYKSFKDWLLDVQGNIAKIDQYDGYYEVDIKNEMPFRSPFMAFINKSVEDSLKTNIAKIKAGEAKDKTEDRIALAICYDKGIGVEQSYAKATQLYLKLAAEKDALAQYEVGCRYFIGKGIKQDDAKALEFLKLSADQGYVLAQFQLGEIYSKGFGAFPVDDFLANAYFFKAAFQGCAEAARKLGCAYAEGRGAVRNYRQAVLCWEIAVKEKDCVAAFNLYGVYRVGKEGKEGVVKDVKKAIQYLHSSAEWGDPDGQFILGQLYYFGDEAVKQDKTEGLKWLHKAAENLCPQAQFFLFKYYMALKQEEKAKKYLLDAAENGHLEAQFLIGFGPSEYKPELQRKMRDYLLKQPVSAVLKEDDFIKSAVVTLLMCDDSSQKQIKKGIKILEALAKDEKRLDVLSNLGEIYISGRVKGIQKDIEKGLAYWLRGATAEDPDCLCNLAYFWQMGMGGKVDKQQALSYFIQAAAKGNANANNEMGDVYSSNNAYDVKKDFKKAIEYFQRAMELDKPSERLKKRKFFSHQQNIFKYASQNLAMLYLKGDDGFLKDESKAVELLKQSAADGMEDAAFSLARYYKEKTVDFLYYLNLAAELGHEKAKEMLKMMNITSAQREVIKQQFLKLDSKASEEPPKNKEQMQSKLQQLSSCLSERLEWKITAENKAWAYISDELQKKLIAVDELKAHVKKSTNGRYLIIFNDIYQCNFKEIGGLFNKAVVKVAEVMDAKSQAMQAGFKVFGSAATASQQSSSASTSLKVSSNLGTKL